MSAHNTYATGIRAEEQALEYLTGQGFACIAERYRNQWGEIDLIVAREQALHFVEVKARRTLEEALYALQPKQQQRMWQCAEGFLSEHAQYRDYTCQFDLIAIAGSQLQYETHILLAE